MSKKSELSTDFIEDRFGNKLFRIKALIDFSDVKAGDFGGYVESEKNLSQEGDAWVFDNAQVYGNAQVYDNAHVCGNANVYGDAWVCDNAQVCGDAQVYGDAWVCGNAHVYGDAWVCGNAGYATVGGFGTRFRTTTFFRCKDKKIRVSCGCFYGTIDEFREQVKETREGGIAKEYLMIADLMEEHFK